MSRKATPYQPRHDLTYAIEVISMGSNGDVTCQCKFYVYEVEVGVTGRKRK